MRTTRVPAVAVAVIITILGAASSSAQAPTPIPANAPFLLVADLNPATDAVTLYRCYVGASAATLQPFAQVPAPSTGTTVQCQHPGLPAGTFVVGMTAVNTFGEGSRSTIEGTAGVPPGPPNGLRIITITVTVATP